MLGELLCDTNPMVVANAVAAISEILETNPNAAKQVGNYSGGEVLLVLVC